MSRPNRGEKWLVSVPDAAPAKWEIAGGGWAFLEPLPGYGWVSVRETPLASLRVPRLLTTDVPVYPEVLGLDSVLELGRRPADRRFGTPTVEERRGRDLVDLVVSTDLLGRPARRGLGSESSQARQVSRDLKRGRALLQSVGALPWAAFTEWPRQAWHETPEFEAAVEQWCEQRTAAPDFVAAVMEEAMNEGERRGLTWGEAEDAASDLLAGAFRKLVQG